ncbi:hypothetical protein L2755_00925 [Shewanella abyssi]|uniref:hypothetical protein n=1 Tax=Shewanella abyssi TaxID=311789 RepID=UPI00201026D1|nr:hypothetical protein [Shewanella abyssi]MCL1048193.1 hypothetical protein [Shewanella abyssi]
MIKIKSKIKLESALLIAFILLIISAHVKAMLDTRATVSSIKTDNPSGSSLAERYLVLGDWPASRQNHLAEFVTEFEINKRVKEDKK